MRKRRTIRLANEKYGDIAAALRERIRDGAPRPGQRLPPRRELSSTFGATLATIQKAFDVLRDDGFVAAHVGRGTFVVDHPPHLFHFALVLYEEDFKSRYIRALREGVERRTARGPERFSVYLDIDRHASSAGQRRLMADIAAGRLAGCIFDMHPAILGDNPLLADRSVPKVALVGESHRPDMPAVTADGRVWFSRALDWLASQGRRRIAWLGIPNAGRGQLPQLLEAAAARGLETSPAWCQVVDYHYPEWCANAVAGIFQGQAGERPDALLIADDNLAEAATAGLAAAGLRIPHDLDVVCLNNFPLPLDVPAAVCQLGFDIDERLDLCLDVLRERAAGRPTAHTVNVSPRFACDGRCETELQRISTAKERIAS